MRDFYIDCETRSSVDLTKVGSYKYAASRWRSAVILWSIYERGLEEPVVTEEPHLYSALSELGELSDGARVFHFGPFDRLMAHAYERPRDPHNYWQSHPTKPVIVDDRGLEWVDLRELSLIYGGPGNLENAAAFFGVGELKAHGKKLIKLFCMPRGGGGFNEPDDFPEEWAQFKAYAAQDTKVLPALHDRFEHLARNGGESLAAHWPAMCAVRRMNERGAPIDLPAVRAAALRMFVAEKEIVEACKAEFGISPTQVGKVKEILGTPNTQATTLDDYEAAGFFDEAQTRLAGYRRAVAGAARKKLERMELMADTDGRVRGCFDYHGANNRRLTSFGVQLQNMVRSKVDESFFDQLGGDDEIDDVLDEVRKNVRGFIKAPEGSAFVAADYKAVELRVGAALAGESTILDAVARGRDVYVEQASEQLGKAPHLIDGEERQVGKTIELASIYQLSWRGLFKQNLAKKIVLPGAAHYRQFSEGYLLNLAEIKNKQILKHVGYEKLINSHELLCQAIASDDAIKTYRRSRGMIVHAWNRLQENFILLVDSPAGTRASYRDMHMARGEHFIKCMRPTGFGQYYWLPEIKLSWWDDEDRYAGKPPNREEISVVKRGPDGAMRRTGTYGGDIFQGFVSGTAADQMLGAMIRIDGDYPPVLSVHDELVAEVPDYLARDVVVDLMGQQMCAHLPGTEGMPIEFEGWFGPRFTKG